MSSFCVSKLSKQQKQILKSALGGKWIFFPNLRQTGTRSEGASLSRSLRALIRRGLIRRTNRRGVFVLSEAGRKLLPVWDRKGVVE